MRLRNLAHTRTGDKGNVVNISVIAYDERDYPRLARDVTVARVAALYGPIVRGSIVRYEMPTIGALNFVMTDALGGGVTRSLALDAHGKSLGSLMLELELPDA